MARLTQLQREMIAHAHATGATIGDLATQYGKTPAAMSNILRQPSMRAITHQFRAEVSDHVERARAFLQFRAMEYAMELDRCALSANPKLSSWALPLALKGVVSPPPRTIQYEGVQHVEHNVNVTHHESDAHAHTRPKAILDALLQAAQAISDRRGAIDITASRHILEGADAKPRPEGYQAVLALTEGAPPPPPHEAQYTAGLARRVTMPTRDDDYIDRDY